MFPSTSSPETLGLLGKQNKLFPSGSDIKCIMFEFPIHCLLLNDAGRGLIS